MFQLFLQCFATIANLYFLQDKDEPIQNYFKHRYAYTARIQGSVRPAATPANSFTRFPMGIFMDPFRLILNGNPTTMNSRPIRTSVVLHRTGFSRNAFKSPSLVLYLPFYWWSWLCPISTFQGKPLSVITHIFKCIKKLLANNGRTKSNGLKNREPICGIFRTGWIMPVQRQQRFPMYPKWIFLGSKIHWMT